MGSRRLAKREMVLTVGNSTKVAAKAVGTYHLNLPSGETLNLNNCYFIYGCVKNLISVSMLLRDGFVVLFDKLLCSISHNNRIIAYANLIDGFFHLEMNGIINCMNKDASRLKKA